MSTLADLGITPDRGEYSDGYLKRHGVVVADAVARTLKCKKCGAEWPEGELVRGFTRLAWHCPNGCNVPQQDKK
jgi:hypothetical protein